MVITMASSGISFPGQPVAQGQQPRVPGRGRRRRHVPAPPPPPGGEREGRTGKGRRSRRITGLPFASPLWPWNVLPPEVECNGRENSNNFFCLEIYA